MGNAFLLIIVGLLLFYIMISDKFYCVEGFMACLGGTYQPGGVSGAASGAASLAAPTVGGVGSIIGAHLPGRSVVDETILRQYGGIR